MSIKESYKATIVASCLGYITQAIMLNFPPLLFLFFQEKLGLELWQVSLLITFNFVTELVVDVIASRFSNKLGTRNLVVLADVFAILGLCTMFFLPDLLSSNFLALSISMMLCGAGGGLMEVLISPIVEACPTKNKGGMMSILHSFYCWGQMGVILISTIFFLIFGIDNWMVVAFFWTLVPLVDLIMFTKVPIYNLVEPSEQASVKDTFKNKLFWLFVVMMICAGASELAMSQWASAFAEDALGVEKWLGDLLGPCLFALCMGLSRVFFGKMSEKINLKKGIFISSIICTVAYLLAIFSPFSWMSLVGCGLCGIGCGLLWPGTYSMASAKMPKGGVFMFGMLALAGDFGCLAGPSIAGQISSIFNNDLKVGFIVSLIFPVTLAVISAILIWKKKKPKESEASSEKSVRYDTTTGE